MATGDTFKLANYPRYFFLPNIIFELFLLKLLLRILRSVKTFKNISKNYNKDKLSLLQLDKTDATVS